MLNIETSNHDVRFFSKTSIVKNSNEQTELSADPKPFGLNFREEYKANQELSKQEGVTAGPSVTNTPSGPDGGVDIDW